MDKPKVGIFGLTGCAGDQLVILNCEDQLLSVLNLLDVRDFTMGISGHDIWGALDIAFVEGAVMSKRDEQRLRAIRKRTGVLIAIGTCATRGGVAAALSDVERRPILEEIYGETGRSYDSAPARALDEVVPVDLAINGCPIEQEQFLHVVSDLLRKTTPVFPHYAVCTECRIRENNCILIEKGEVCCGPLTEAGCGARCPSLGVPCAGCRGPAEDANLSSARAMLLEKGFESGNVARKLRTFGADRAQTPVS
jgi:sulfhydrogenase subunit delta